MAADRSSERPYLSICAIYRNEAAYLREWIEFHRLVGVERFFLYDNQSTDGHRDVLAPYLSAGIVVHHEWPQYPGQLEAYAHCLTEHAGDSRWIAVLDLDEFLFSPSGQPVAELLPEYEQWPAIGVCRHTFGTSGHDEPTQGLVIENYVHRIDRETFSMNRGVKCIVDPRRASGGPNPHQFVYSEGQAVDENGKPLRGPTPSGPVSYSKFRVNHYWTKSTAEFNDKFLVRRLADRDQRYNRNFMSKLGFTLEDLNEFRDETILSYLPALKRALADSP